MQKVGLSPINPQNDNSKTKKEPVNENKAIDEEGGDEDDDEENEEEYEIEAILDSKRGMFRKVSQL